METMVKNWTDERLEERFDAIDQRLDVVDQRFDVVDQRFERLERRMDAGFREARTEMNGRLDRIDAKFDALNRTLLQLGGVTIAALLGLIATQI
jgi:tetrahydromethanopterin S-methyltransferase subunit G